VTNLRNKNEKGFTLIELLVVIAIIGLLASVVLLALNSARAKSRDAKRLADVRQLASALELYFNDSQDGYPALTEITGTTGLQLVPTYIGQWPSAPTPPDGTCTTSNNPYSYTVWGSGNSGYSLAFCLGAATGGYTAGPLTLSPQGIR
jgi:prepilin-type N-terminal cleavage/methylation domain-containing protein